jgi:hypothetical protein
VASMGYLLARHVPRREMPEGLREIRAVAGWSSAPTPSGAYEPSHPARRCLQAAREHAQRLGAPQDLDELTATLADGVIRTERSVQAFGGPLTGSGVDLRALAEFAGWCGRGKTWRVVPAGTTPDGEPVTAVVADRRLVTRAQRVPRQVVAATGVVRRSVMMRQLTAHEVRFDAAVNDAEIDVVCGLRGGDGWVCRPDDPHSTLADTIRRIVSITGPIRPGHRDRLDQQLDPTDPRRPQLTTPTLLPRVPAMPRDCHKMGTARHPTGLAR